MSHPVSRASPLYRAGSAHFLFTVCLYEEAGFPACRDLGSSNRDLGKPGQPGKAG